MKWKGVIQMNTFNKRGQAIEGLSNNILGLVVAIIVLVLGLVVLQDLRDTQTAGTEAFSAANESLVGVGDFSDFVPIIVIAVAASSIIGVILFGFAFAGRER